MDKEQVIAWCKANLNTWPNTTKNKFPEGWRWVIRHLPYQLPIYLLTNAAHDEIHKEDVGL